MIASSRGASQARTSSTRTGRWTDPMAVFLVEEEDSRWAAIADRYEPRATLSEPPELSTPEPIPGSRRSGRRPAAQESRSSSLIGIFHAGLESLSQSCRHLRFFADGSSGVAPGGARRMVATPAAEQ